MTVIWLMFAGAAGAVCRYMLGMFFARKFSKQAIPIPMLLVNVTGSFGLGVFLSLYMQTIPLDAYDNTWFVTAGTGFFGAFTTFSTFAVEAVNLLRSGKRMPFFWYTALSIVGALMAFIFGFLIFSP
jgi:fluoride exporter